MAKVTEIYKDLDAQREAIDASDKNVSDIETVHGNIERTKKNRWQFLGESIVETAKTVGISTVKNVLLPAAQEAITSSITQVMNTIVYGDARGRPDKNGSRSAYTSYSSSYSRNERDSNYTAARREPDFLQDEIVFYAREDADYILREMRKIVNDFEFVTVSDMYELAHKERWITQASTRYGWARSDILKAAVCNTRNGWRIDLPAPKSI